MLQDHAVKAFHRYRSKVDQIRFHVQVDTVAAMADMVVAMVDTGAARQKKLKFRLHVQVDMVAAMVDMVAALQKKLKFHLHVQVDMAAAMVDMVVAHRLKFRPHEVDTVAAMVDMVAAMVDTVAALQKKLKFRLHVQVDMVVALQVEVDMVVKVDTVVNNPKCKRTKFLPVAIPNKRLPIWWPSTKPKARMFKSKGAIKKGKAKTIGKKPQ